jgi:hypothetical protein
MLQCGFRSSFVISVRWVYRSFRFDIELLLRLLVDESIIELIRFERPSRIFHMSTFMVYGTFYTTLSI